MLLKTPEIQQSLSMSESTPYMLQSLGFPKIYLSKSKEMASMFGKNGIVQTTRIKRPFAERSNILKLPTCSSPMSTPRHPSSGHGGKFSNIIIIVL